MEKQLHVALLRCAGQIELFPASDSDQCLGRVWGWECSLGAGALCSFAHRNPMYSCTVGACLESEEKGGL